MESDKVRELEEKVRELQVKLYGEKVIRVAEKNKVEPEVAYSIVKDYYATKIESKHKANSGLSLSDAIEAIRAVFSNVPRYHSLNISNKRKIAEAFARVVEAKGVRGYQKYLAKRLNVSDKRIDYLRRRIGVKFQSSRRKASQFKKAKSNYDRLKEFFEKERTYWNTLESVSSKTGIPANEVSNFLAEAEDSNNLLTEIDSNGRVKFRIRNTRLL